MRSRGGLLQKGILPFDSLASGVGSKPSQMEMRFDQGNRQGKGLAGNHPWNNLKMEARKNGRDDDK
jgi:hypothetical protein